MIMQPGNQINVCLLSASKLGISQQQIGLLDTQKFDYNTISSYKQNIAHWKFESKTFNR